MLTTLYSYLAAHTTTYIVLCGVLGLLMGSFLNVVIYRLPVMMQRDWMKQALLFVEEQNGRVEGLEPPKDERFNLMLPRSSCPQCGHQIRAHENIPVLSYLFLHGKCSQCGAAISLRYPLIELVTALLTAFIGYWFGLTWLALWAILFTWSLIAMTMIDVDHQLLPDDLTLPLLWLGLLINISGLLTPLEDAVIGAIAGYLSLWSVYWLFKLVTGKEGMGFGDFKLLAALGAWLGWQHLPLIIVLSSLVGALVGVSLILLRGRDRNIPIPFGPYLATAGWIALVWGDTITSGYLHMVTK